MQIALHLSKKWRETLSQCLVGEESYEKLSKRVIDYYITTDSEKIQSFLKVLEEVLKHQKTTVKSKFFSLMMLKSASEKEVNNFSRLLAEQEGLCKIVYQIAITKPLINCPAGSTIQSSPEGKRELISNKCIKLATECLFWRLNFDDLQDTTAKIFTLLHQQAVKNGVKFPKDFQFFVVKTREETKESLGTKNFQNKEESTSKNFIASLKIPSQNADAQAFSTDINRKAALAELEASLVGLRQSKIEEGKTYIQEGLLGKPSELRDRLTSFLTEIKQSIQILRNKSLIFFNEASNRNEQEVLDELQKEEQTLMEIEDYVQEYFMKFHRFETKQKIIEYLCARTTLSTEEKGDSDSSSNEGFDDI